MDGRNKALRPRTINRLDRVDQPMGWPGINQLEQRQDAPIRTFETPLINFPADILIPSGFNGAVPLPPNCAQIAFLDVVPGVAASINAGGGRTIKDGFIYNGSFQSLSVATDALGSCTIQLAGW
jgi:hypothetical protein